MNRRTQPKFGLLFVCLCFTMFSYAQSNVTGKVVDGAGEPIPFATLLLPDGPIAGTTTDIEGEFFVPYLNEGQYTFQVSSVGFRTELVPFTVADQDVDLYIVLTDDLLELTQVIKTGTFNPLSKLESSVAITTVNSTEIRKRKPQGTGELLSSVPGVYVDHSSGNINSRIIVRGLTTGTTNLLGQASGSGFRYVSLQEDGLPVISTISNSAAPDYFHRVDHTVGRLEAIRGGSSSVTAANSPGGIFNFISKTGGVDFGGETSMTYGLYDNGRWMSRADVGMGGPLNRNWRWYAGGFYRHDNGPREIDGVANAGGQLKANLAYVGEELIVKFYGKYLNDKNTTYGNVPTKSVGEGGKFESFDERYSAIFPSLTADVNDYSTGSNPTLRSFNSADRAASESMMLGINIDYTLGNGWSISEKMKASLLSQRINQFTEVPGASPDYAAYGMDFYDVSTGNSIVIEDVTNNFITLSAMDFNVSMVDAINQVSLIHESENHRFTLGNFSSYNRSNFAYNFNFLSALLEPHNQLVGMRIPNPYIGWEYADGSAVSGPQYYQVTNEHGFFLTNPIMLPGSELNTAIIAGYVNEEWRVSEQFTIDGGVRLEYIKHFGHKEGFGNALETGITPLYNPDDRQANPAFNPAQPVSAQNPPYFPNAVLANGLDNDPFTFFDGATKYANGQQYEFDHSYLYWSGSLGFNYKFSEQLAGFARASRGVKAPDVDYYVYNFDNVAINPQTAGVNSFDDLLEEVRQAELGVKVNGQTFSLFSTVFYNNLKNVPYSTLGTTSTLETFFTPTTFNESTTYGLETEVIWKPVDQLKLRVNGTYQLPVWNTFKYYDIDSITYQSAQGVTVDQELFDRYQLTLKDKTIADLPDLFVNFDAEYELGALTLGAGANYVGKRAFNVHAVEYAPQFITFDASASLALGQMTINLDIDNLTNTLAYTNFSTYLGASLYRESLTREQIESYQASGRPVLGTPILPRLARVSVSYQF
ncbi:TonB-dependent receptor [Marinoscillum furvescens]|uniref:Outer membrane receptor protein involved in Fe transport n=1 Tax=Marinoscillum furvescens DSM 4134 TaxID=1122208 RepID=A0A3D9KXE7_MARFU|nr:TonB-dependent receptor [Marinoscillum furvescens]RED93174.1 outer membrane receptor protein involved in Fe transport [Marinoscillum furvescens DSM 4134]